LPGRCQPGTLGGPVPQAPDTHATTRSAPEHLSTGGAGHDEDPLTKASRQMVSYYLVRIHRALRVTSRAGGTERVSDLAELVSCEACIT